MVTASVNGRKEATRLVRAHRLWETYLEQSGTPREDLHQKAHELEHISDQDTVKYLDDKLGHPITDPHGTEIPLDEIELEGTEFKVSLLRSGHRAEITRLLPAADPLGLKVGVTIEVGSRSKDGKYWNLRDQNGQQFQLKNSMC